MLNPYPPYFPSLVAAETLEELDQAVRGAVETLAGREALRQSAFLILHGPEPPCGLIVSQSSLLKARYCRPFRLRPSAVDLIASGQTVTALNAGPAELFEDPDSAAGLEVHAPLTLLAPIRTDERLDGAWIVSLEPNAGTASTAAAAAANLEPLAAAINLVFTHVFERHLARKLHEQTVQLHEAMLKVMVTSNREELLSRLLGFLTRQFGLDRVTIALIQPQSQMLRSELHTGFPDGFVPFSVAMDARNDFFVWAVERGEALIFESVRQTMPARIPACETGRPPERAVVIPLTVGARPLGMIYGDQPLHDGRPLFQSVLEMLSRMVGCALEHVNLLTDAEQRAETDPLTGLRNRFFLDRALEMEIPRVKRYNQPISLLMIDLCDFKQTNDTYGHQFGDYILRETANLLKDNVRRPDFVIRYGGDEFLVLMVNTGRSQAELVRERIEQAFVERNRLQTDERMMIKISVGLRSADAGNIESLIDEADVAMYAHKSRQKRRQLIHALLAGNLDRIEAADKIVGSLCNMLYRKAPYYPDHARRVTHIALLLARRLDLEIEEIESLMLAGLLHDVGKVSLPTEIIQKTSPLTPSEKQAIRHHPVLGEEFFEGIEHLDPLRPLIRSHHERFDGAIVGPDPGYPDGLVGERIPIGARILKLAESVDAMLHQRGDRAALPPEKAIEKIRAQAGHAFDPQLTRLLLTEKDWRRRLGDREAIAELLGQDRA